MQFRLNRNQIQLRPWTNRKFYKVNRSDWGEEKADKEMEGNVGQASVVWMGLLGMSVKCLCLEGGLRRILLQH